MMDDELAIWESQLGKLTPQQRQQLLEWLREEQEAWADREEEWERVQRAMAGRSAKTEGRSAAARAN
ncbi:MAG TPA: hypothetical protein EYP56_19465 [Planctomycetaceae bacterium]|nr:hypothetical protein [Planctomycetaceae bacterium]